MLTADQRRHAQEVWDGASDFHRAWIADLVAAADHGHEASQKTLLIFLKHRRATERTAVAYHKTMDDLAQLKIETEHLRAAIQAAVGLDDTKRAEGSDAS